MFALNVSFSRGPPVKDCRITFQLILFSWLWTDIQTQTEVSCAGNSMYKNYCVDIAEKKGGGVEKNGERNSTGKLRNKEKVSGWWFIIPHCRKNTWPFGHGKTFIYWLCLSFISLVCFSSKQGEKERGTQAVYTLLVDLLHNPTRTGGKNKKKGLTCLSDFG